MRRSISPCRVVNPVDLRCVSLAGKGVVIDNIGSRIPSPHVHEETSVNLQSSCPRVHVQRNIGRDVLPCPCREKPCKRWASKLVAFVVMLQTMVVWRDAVVVSNTIALFGKRSLPPHQTTRCFNLLRNSWPWRRPLIVTVTTKCMGLR